MPDIAKCLSKDCPLREKCYRFTCEPSPFWQSYSSFKPTIDEETKEVKCDYYWEVKDVKKY